MDIDFGKFNKDHFFFFFFFTMLAFELRGFVLTKQVWLEPHLQSILLCLFWRWGLANSLPWQASNLNPPNFSLLSSYNYRHKPQCHTKVHFLSVGFGFLLFLAEL
jgi:hypothetical protein